PRVLAPRVTLCPYTTLFRSSKPLWALVVLCGVMAAIIATLVSFAFSARTTRFEVSPAGLSIRGTLYGRTVPWEKLDPGTVRIVEDRKSTRLNSSHVKISYAV